MKCNYLQSCVLQDIFQYNLLMTKILKIKIIPTRRLGQSLYHLYTEITLMLTYGLKFP